MDKNLPSSAMRKSYNLKGNIRGAKTQRKCKQPVTPGCNMPKCETPIRIGPDAVHEPVIFLGKEHITSIRDARLSLLSHLDDGRAFYRFDLKRTVVNLVVVFICRRALKGTADLLRNAQFSRSRHEGGEEQPHHGSICHASSFAIGFAKYVKIKSAPARRIEVRLSTIARSSSIHPFRAAAIIIEYSPLT